MLRNKRRERACKAGSVVQEREERWASFSSIKGVLARTHVDDQARQTNG